jgi:hypothetical protein
MALERSDSRDVMSAEGLENRCGDHTPPPCHRTSASPVPRRTHHRNGGHNVIIERVVEKSSTVIIYPTLTRTNYAEWSLVMHVNLQAAELWEAIKFETDD